MLKVGDNVVVHPNYSVYGAYSGKMRMGIIIDTERESWLSRCDISVRWSNGNESHHFTDGRSLIKVG